MESTLKVSKAKAYFYTLAYFFVIIFSLTLLYPYAHKTYHGWLINNSTLDGKKLKFKANLGLYYMIYLTGVLIIFQVYSLLALISVVLDHSKAVKFSVFFSELITSNFGTLFTILIVFFINARTFKYMVKCTHFEGDGRRSYMKLQPIYSILSSVISKALILTTAFFGYPFIVIIKEKFINERKHICEQRCKFAGRILPILRTVYLGILLSILTLTLYLPWLFYQIQKYIITNTHIRTKEEELLEVDKENLVEISLEE